VMVGVDRDVLCMDSCADNTQDGFGQIGELRLFYVDASHFLLSFSVGVEFAGHADSLRQSVIDVVLIQQKQK
jgi:hypothetical protein